MIPVPVAGMLRARTRQNPFQKNRADLHDDCGGNNSSDTDTCASIYVSFMLLIPSGLGLTSPPTTTISEGVCCIPPPIRLYSVYKFSTSMSGGSMNPEGILSSGGLPNFVIAGADITGCRPL